MTDRLNTTTPDGTSISYRTWGDPASDRAVMLVHALAMSADFWEPVAETLRNDTFVIAIDCRGHGASDKPAGPYDVSLFAEDLIAVMDAAGRASAVIAGASMGGCVAQAFAASHAGRTAGLALLDTTAFYGDDAPEAWEERAQRASQNGMESLVDFQKTRWFSDEFRDTHPDAVEKPIATFVGNDVDAYVETCRMLGRCDMRAALPGFRMPVEVAVGEEDYATPVEMAEALVAEIPGARLTIMDVVRHFSPLEAPDRVADVMRRVFERVQSANA